VDKLLAIQCTAAEVAAFFNCTTDALSDHAQRKHGTTFSEYARPKLLLGHASLRRKQYEQAMKGNTTLLLWLGKQYLDQADKIDQRVESEHTVKHVTAEHVREALALDDFIDVEVTHEEKEE